MKRLSARSCLVIKMEDNGSGSGLSNSTESVGIIEDFTFSLASLSIIACIISLVVLKYFKLYRSFIYRLVFYSFTSLIIFSLGTIAFTIVYILQKNHIDSNLGAAVYFFFHPASNTLSADNCSYLVYMCIGSL